MGLFSPNWGGIGKTFGRGPHTNDPSDPAYRNHWNVVEGSLNAPTDDMIIGAYNPEHGSRRAGTQANIRFCGDIAHIDRAILPEPAVGFLKPAAWAAEHRTIDPVAIPRSELPIEMDRYGRRTISIPDEYGGGTIAERPDAIRGRANNASAGEQVRSLRGFFSDPRWRR